MFYSLYRRCKRPLLALLCAPVVFLAPAVAVAQLGQASDEARYRSCLENARVAPEDTFEQASAWIGEGSGGKQGSENARHCAAMALIEMGHYGEAARRLEGIVQDLPADKLAFQSALLAQAGQAWLLAGDLERAYGVQTAALKATPDDVELLVDRGITLASAGHFKDSVLDFTRAFTLAPERADVLVYRASAYRQMSETGLAKADVESALQKDPNNPEGLLERGILRRLTGDPDGARDDWVRAAELAEGTPTGDAAQANIERLDLKAD